MKIYLDQNVWDAAIERLEYLFDEFKNVIVCCSGGKDSTITLELALIVARKKKRLPLPVYFLDQEAEWESVIDYMREIMSRDEVKPLWIQVPIFLPNSLSQEEPYLVTWEEGREWMRPKEDISIKDNHELKGKAEKEAKRGYWYNYFVKSIDMLYPDEPAVFLAGMRAEEAPQRLTALTSGATYKHITWGKELNKRKKHYNFYPLFDWSVSDVWKAIHDNNWNYCNIYNEYFRYGLPVKDMRVSNLHHETAVKCLHYLHELEGHTWDKLTRRLKGINQAKHIEKTELIRVNTLPYMFKDWKEYRDFLTEKLITNEKQREFFRVEWKKHDKLYDMLRNPKELYKEQIKSILVNDNEFARIESYLQRPYLVVYRDWKKGRTLRNPPDSIYNKQIKEQFLK